MPWLHIEGLDWVMLLPGLQTILRKSIPVPYQSASTAVQACTHAMPAESGWVRACEGMSLHSGLLCLSILSVKAQLGNPAQLGGVAQLQTAVPWEVTLCGLIPCS